VPTRFSFEYWFRAADPTALYELYFDPEHTRTTDDLVDVAAREVLEETDTGDEHRRLCKVTPRRQLPAFMRPFLPGTLHYVEEAIWRRPADRIDIDVRPSILGGRARVTSSYRLLPEADGVIRRTYEGMVSVEVALLGARIERGIVADLERSLSASGGCTQAYLDRIGASAATGT
jgi:hypothetical protein